MAQMSVYGDLRSAIRCFCAACICSNCGTVTKRYPCCLSLGIIADSASTECLRVQREVNALFCCF
ncbi:hypothetical protein QUA86_09225 [Microcoleus sp. F6_B6]